MRRIVGVGIADWRPGVGVAGMKAVGKWCLGDVARDSGMGVMAVVAAEIARQAERTAVEVQKLACHIARMAAVGSTGSRNMTVARRFRYKSSRFLVRQAERQTECWDTVMTQGVA